MSHSLFFNSSIEPSLTIMNPSPNDPAYSPVNSTSIKNLLTFSLEAELSTRLELMDKTALVTITDLHGNIMYANDLFCSVSGYKRHEVIGKTHQVIRHPDLQDETVTNMMKMLLNGKMWSGMIKNRSKSGEIFWCNTTVAPVMDQENEPTKFIWMRNDITALKRTESELYSAKEEADQRVIENVKRASRIQSVILPSENELQEIFPASFVINAPQQNVSGDFHWFDQQKSETVFVLGDGTGHGVSAAFISLIAMTALEFIVKENQENDPGKIITALNDFLFRALKKHRGSEMDQSIDMAVCSYNHKTRMLKYSAAKSKVYLVRGTEVYSLDRDDASVGMLNNHSFKVNSKAIFLEKGDRIFMMSDGLTDQAGGPKNKRMGSKQVRELLQRTNNIPVAEQKEEILKFFLNWKGENEQSDDLSMLAFSIS
jgi:PAS domain S-box-containing protein